ncbi:LysR family transcriptional regulator [Paraburkholderia sp.]|uniref:LysR family transcriptional regulator n=1 Tax=Paraburkholderia sp. TaxID=1926495 RepID=UPI003C7B8D8A
MRLNKLDLNLLICLDALLAEKNVSRAADRSFLSQPAMSAALARLRAHFQDELLVQVGRTMTLTSFAQTLAKPVRDVLLQMQAITSWKPDFDPAKSDRLITIQASDYVTSVFMVNVFERAWLEAPSMQFDLRLLDTTYKEQLDSGAVDILIVPAGLTSNKHPSANLFTDSWSCIVWLDNPLVGDQISIDQYLSLGHVISEWGGRLVALDELLMKQGGYARRREIVAPSFSLTPQLVMRTNRIATVQTRLAQQMASQLPLRLIPCPVCIPPIIEAMQWHRYQEQDPAIQWFCNLLRAVGQDLAAC